MQPVLNFNIHLDRQAVDAGVRQAAQHKAQIRQQELLADDARRIRNPDINRPFSSTRDAVDRLLPYHVRTWAFEQHSAALREVESISKAAYCMLVSLGVNPDLREVAYVSSLHPKCRALAVPR